MTEQREFTDSHAGHIHSISNDDHRIIRLSFRMIHVCSLARLHDTVEETGATHVVTLLKDRHLVLRPNGIAADRHLVLGMDDICEPLYGYVCPAEEHITDLLGFVRGWDRDAPLVVHCYAGISRSTAGAFIAACALNPQRDEAAIAWSIRQASPSAMPNRRLVSLADGVLGRNGRMVAAVEAIGAGIGAYEGEPFRLELE
jgi:predicted protein tyrosine phosphatase